jgi:hypothetical protein
MDKKRIFGKLNVMFIIVITIMFKTFTGCQEENDLIPDTVPVGLKKYFESEDYADLKENFAFEISNFSFDNIIEENPVPEVIIYYVKIQKNNRSGILAIFSKNNGEVYKSLFEDRSELKKQTNGLIQKSIPQKISSSLILILKNSQ